MAKPNFNLEVDTKKVEDQIAIIEEKLVELKKEFKVLSEIEVEFIQDDTKIQ